MDALRITAAVLLFLSCANLSRQMVQDSSLDETVPNAAVSTVVPTTTRSVPTTTRSVPKDAGTTAAPSRTVDATTDANGEVNITAAANCTTSRHLSGKCVPRQLCEYSTNAIDLTLYEPRGYVRPCKLHECCCPMKAIVVMEKEKPTYQPDDNFEFDADD